MAPLLKCFLRKMGKEEDFLPSGGGDIPLIMCRGVGVLQTICRKKVSLALPPALLVKMPLFK